METHNLPEVSAFCAAIAALPSEEQLPVCEFVAGQLVKGGNHGFYYRYKLPNSLRYEKLRMAIFGVKEYLKGPRPLRVPLVKYYDPLPCVDTICRYVAGLPADQQIEAINRGILWLDTGCKVAIFPVHITKNPRFALVAIRHFLNSERS